MQRALGPQPATLRALSSLPTSACCHPTYRLILKQPTIPAAGCCSSALFPTRGGMMLSNWGCGVLVTFGNVHYPRLLSPPLLCLLVLWYCLIIVLTLAVPPGIKGQWGDRCRSSSIRDGSIHHFLGGISGSPVLLLWWDSHAWDGSKQRPELHSVIFQWMFKHLLSKSASFQDDKYLTPLQMEQ